MKKLLALLLAGFLFSAVYSVRGQEETQIVPPPATAKTSETASAPSGPEKIQAEKPIPEGWIQTGETSILDPETGEWITEPVYGPPPSSLSDLYMEGGYEWMTGITLCLIAMLFAAWKAPRWVKELGLLALVVGMFAMLLGFFAAADVIHTHDLEIGKDISGSLLFWGLRVALIAPMYALIVYGLSLVLRIVFKPRI